MKPSVILYGPQGSRKTLHARAIADMYGLQDVRNAEWLSTGMPCPPHDTLVIVNDRPDPRLIPAGVRCVHVADAMHGARIA